MKVLDASALVGYLTDGEDAEEVRRRIGSGPGWLWAPAVVDAEVGHALRSMARVGKINPKAAYGALGELMEMPLERVSHRFLAERAWALRNNLSFYDGLYIALAEALAAPLLTFDARLAKAPGLRAEIEVIPTQAA